MPSSKRERELARAKAARQAARRAAARRKRRQRQLAVGGSLLGVLAIVGVVLLVSRGGNEATLSDGSPSATPSATVKAGECAYPKSNDAKPKSVGTPPAKPAIKGKAKAVLVLNKGTVRFTMNGAKAPCTVNSFDFLAGKKYFDSTPCHRLTTKGIFVLQCGDPTGSGSSGPGYSITDENLTGATYPAGTVAMANSGPNTNGSQFFLVYKDSQLPASYTPFGTITGGLDVLKAIAKTGVKGGGGDGAPAKAVTIKTFRVSA